MREETAIMQSRRTRRSRGGFVFVWEVDGCGNG